MRFFKTWEESKNLPHNGRLAWYTGAATIDFWTESSNKLDVARMLKDAREGHYPLRSLLQRFLPKDKPTIDGWCSVGAIVFGLQQDGYNVIGLDWSQQTVEKAKSVAPTLNIMVGDIHNMPFADGLFGGYISLGIVEHFIEGPDKALTEASRVLGPGGVLILSVPYFSPVRQFKGKWGLYPKPANPPDPDDFYQFAFSRKEMTSLLNKYGFELESLDYFGVLNGASRELGYLGTTLAKLPKIASIINRAERIRSLRWLIGHSVIFIARKRNQS